jgi:DNA-binding NarL/FixJ family response regulator
MRASVLASLSGMPLVGVSFHKTGASFSPAWVDLDDVFNLTSSESRIVSMLLAGSSAESIAEQLKLSINTVRTHIKHAYEKLDVCSREELWRRLAPYRLT